MTAPSQAGAVGVVYSELDGFHEVRRKCAQLRGAHAQTLPDGTLLYTTPLAAVPVEALEELVAKWREQIDANRKKPFRTAEEGAMCDTLDQSADELTTLIKERSNG